MLHDALDLTTGPVAIRYPKTPAPDVGEDEVGVGLAARKVRTGSDVAVLAVGKMLAAATEAAEVLAAQGIDATVYDVRCAKPLDPAMIADAAAHPLVVTIEDGLADGGIGSSIRGLLEDAEGPTPRVRVLGVPTEYLDHGSVDEILARLGLDADGIVRCRHRVTLTRTRCGAASRRRLRRATRRRGSRRLRGR